MWGGGGDGDNQDIGRTRHVDKAHQSFFSDCDGKGGSSISHTSRVLRVEHTECRNAVLCLWSTIDEALLCNCFLKRMRMLDDFKCTFSKQMAAARREEGAQSSMYLNPVLDSESKVRYRQGLWQQSVQSAAKHHPSGVSEAGGAAHYNLVETGVDCLTWKSPTYDFDSKKPSV